MDSSTIQLTRMEYAMKSLSLLYPKSRHVAVRTAVVTQELLSEPRHETHRARPCRVSTADRKVRKGIMAHSLEDLLHKLGKRSQRSLSQKPAKKIDVARITFDLYKLNPQDFIGCLNVKATLYDTYSLSYDLHCYRAKRVLREMLRWALFSMQATGHMLLGTSGYMQQFLDATEEEQPPKPKAASLLPACLKILQ